MSNYNTNAITSRIQVLNGAKFAAGTYQSGQLLGRVTASGAFTAYNSGASNGAEVIAAVCLNDVVIPTGGGNAAVCKGEFIREGIEAVLGSAVSDVIAGACWDAGIILN